MPRGRLVFFLHGIHGAVSSTGSRCSYLDSLMHLHGQSSKRVCPESEYSEWVILERHWMNMNSRLCSAFTNSWIWCRGTLGGGDCGANHCGEQREKREWHEHKHLCLCLFNSIRVYQAPFPCCSFILVISVADQKCQTHESHCCTTKVYLIKPQTLQQPYFLIHARQSNYNSESNLSQLWVYLWKSIFKIFCKTSGVC